MNTSHHSRTLVPWSSEIRNETALVCIPWAGAGATPFRAWGPVVGDAADVYGVRLAGRESRQTEPPGTVLADTVAELVREVTALGVPRVALFGHCSGALLAFELAHALGRADGAPEVAHLLVASQLPPRAFAEAAAVTSDDDLARFVPEDLRSEPELLELLLPILSADMRLVSDYGHAATAPLAARLTVVYGAADEHLDRAAVDGWRAETTGAAELREVAGADHLFGGAAWPALAGCVRDALG
ncbi:thioesterase II family protein [Streptomyces sp. LMG1-1-1.1]|uniref:thioesterase II family protein n=1 Tax=Streptomyces sp. LMG1-1-1.1 TaxID=3135245 RepID=UPI0034675F28